MSPSKAVAPSRPVGLEWEEAPSQEVWEEGQQRLEREWRHW